MYSKLRELPRGYFDVIKPEGQSLRVVGWMFRMDRPFEEFEIRVDGTAAAREPVIELERVGKAFPRIPHAGRSGFSFTVTPQLESGVIEVAGRWADRERGRMCSAYRMDLDVLGPVPPVPLMLRVTGSNESDFFRADGLRIFADLAAAVERRGGFDRVRRMLDWGCGCGRLTAHFLADGRVAEICGTDIDSEAIAWCEGAFPQARFQQTGPYPPLPFPDGHFDLVVAYSVFTHLEREVQKAWLSEMKRILSPGGLLLATVHGEFAALFNSNPANLWESLAFELGAKPIIAGEIADSVVDGALDGIAPAGYYRGVLQTKKYTMREWSKTLDILEYREAGVGNYQDLVVLRRPGEGSLHPRSRTGRAGY